MIGYYRHMQNRHLSRHARDRFTLDSLHFPDLTAAKTVAAQMNVSPGDLYALGLIDEALRILIERHSTPTQMTFASSFLDSKLGAPSVRETQVTFVSEFPTKPVYEGKVKAEEYLTAAPASPTEKRPTVNSIEELLLVNLHNNNPAAEPMTELFDDKPLEKTPMRR